MKLLAISKARSIWLFPMIDLNPRGRAITDSAIAGLASRYKFSKTPNLEDIQSAREKNQPLMFLGGQFGRKGEEIIVDLSVYNDGVIADTRSSTKDGDAFLEDSLEWICNEFGLTAYQEILQKKIYLSELYVTTEKPLFLLNPKLEKLGRLISSKVLGFKDVQMELGSIGFWDDQNKPMKPVNFRLERAEGVPFSENRYYSLAPLETESHLEILEEIDNLLTD